MSCVLILTHPEDAHADAVERHLRADAVTVHRVDTAGLGGDLALEAHLAGDPGRPAVRGALGDCDLAQVHCVWHRRPSEPAGTGGDSAGAELRAAIGGVLAGLPHLNHPADMAVAALKPYQLVTAARCGLPVPETVIAAGSPAARDLADRHRGRVVVKPLSRGAGRILTEGDLTGWSYPAHLTQQQVDKQCDVRLTIVDDDWYAVRIDSPHLDWRADPGQCRYAVTAVPVGVTAPVRELMARLRLRFGALDFAVDRSGRWWFLEVNPNGQWLWLEQATGIPVSRALATALTAPGSARCRLE